MSTKTGGTRHGQDVKAPKEPSEGQAGSTDRMLVLSDGIFAIAITLLVLDLKVPEINGSEAPTVGRIAAALLAQWPTYFAFLLSFLNVGVMWANHVMLFRYIKRCDHTVTTLNTLLLFCISVNPFITSLLARYLILSAAHREVAMLVFSGMWFITASLFNGIWFYAAKGSRLLDRRYSPVHYRDVTARFRYGPLIYFIIFVVSVIGLPIVSLVMSACLTLFFALPYNASSVIEDVEDEENSGRNRLVQRSFRRR